MLRDKDLYRTRRISLFQRTRDFQPTVSFWLEIVGIMYIQDVVEKKNAYTRLRNVLNLWAIMNGY